MTLTSYLTGLDDFDDHLSGYFVDMLHEFAQVTPWNVYDLELRHYLALTAYIDASRKAAKEARRGR